jgi:hypothetical protein
VSGWHPPDQGALSECLLGHEVEVEPNADAPGAGGLVGSLDLEDSEVAATLEECGFTSGKRGVAS